MTRPAARGVNNVLLCILRGHLFLLFAGALRAPAAGTFVSQRLSASLSNAASRLSSSFVSSFISTPSRRRCDSVSDGDALFFGDVTPVFFPSPSFNPTTRCLTNRLKILSHSLSRPFPHRLVSLVRRRRLQRLAALAQTPPRRALTRRRRVISPSSVTIVLAPSSFGSVSLSSLSSLSASVSLPSSSALPLARHRRPVLSPSATASEAPSPPSSTRSTPSRCPPHPRTSRAWTRDRDNTTFRPGRL